MGQELEHLGENAVDSGLGEEIARDGVWYQREGCLRGFVGLGFHWCSLLDCTAGVKSY